MKRLALVALFATTAVAVHAETYVDYARVRSAQPQYESISVPRQECSSQVVNEVQPVGGQRQYGGAVLGGLAGALLGNQVGGGHGREAATAVGAVVGAFTGDQLANANTPSGYQQVPREVTSCRTVNELQTRISGYRVDYEYRGQSFTTMLPENPGPQLQVRVSIDPVGR
ncbi:MAG TPA: glycine zipper 2TM domain-containing protein [Ramlibacter sp.]|nr:glycine zipper 2TM domain-containing protein [Ramlibacter sp.]